MLKEAVLFTLLLLSLPAKAIELHCGKPLDSEPVIYQSEFHWGYSRTEMEKRFEEIYQGPKRLFQRAYFDPETGGYVFDHDSGERVTKIRLPKRFIESITRHIESALENQYASFVFFPDMGHNHFFVPTELYRREIEPLADSAAIYQKLLDEPSVRVLYHTAEQLEMKPRADDTYLQWRYATRNIVGLSCGKVEPLFAWGQSFNTLRELDGHYYWDSGLNLSANHRGCFPYKHGGKTYYFDLSLSDLPMDPELWPAVE